MVRFDPGPCPICGAAHTACTADRGPIVVSQLPARDALAATAQSVEPPAELVPEGSDEDTFTTATYRGRKKPVFPANRAVREGSHQR